MKDVLSIVVIISIVCTVAVVGCVPGLRSSKSDSNTERVSDAKGVPAPAVTTKMPNVPKGELDRLLATPPPPDKLVGSTGAPSTLIKPSDFSGRDEVSRAALMFAQGQKDVKHVKTCYSKAYGGWHLLLYVQKGKKLNEDEYFWNGETKEWELSGRRKDLASQKMDILLKAELPDEKCFVLK